MNVQKINYQKELDKILKRLEEEGRVPTLLIHSCCAPCSSYCLLYTSHLPGAKLKQLQVAVPPMELQEQFAVFVAQTDKSKVAVRKY